MVDFLPPAGGKAESRGDGEGSIPGRRSVCVVHSPSPPGRRPTTASENRSPGKRSPGSGKSPAPCPPARESVSFPTALAIRALPPLPVSVKIDGVPSEALHVSVDVPRNGSRPPPRDLDLSLRPSRTASEWTVAAREIDLSDSARWVSAVAASLGADAGGAARYLAGIEGKGKRTGGSTSPREGRGDGTVQPARGGPWDPAAGLAGGRGVREGGIRRPLECARGGKVRRRRVPRPANGDGETGPESREGGGDRDRPVFSLLHRDNPGSEGDRRRPVCGPTRSDGWEVPRFTAGRKSSRRARRGSRAYERKGTSRLRRDVLPPLRLAPGADRRRGESLRRVADEGVVDRLGGPTSLLLLAGGRSGVPSVARGARAGGVIRLGTSRGTAPFSGGLSRPARLGVGDGSFRSARCASGVPCLRKQARDAIEGEILTRAPDSRLAWSVSLREPFGFASRAVQPGDPGNGTGKTEAGASPSAGARRSRSPPRGGEDLRDRSRRIAHLSGGGFELSGRTFPPDGSDGRPLDRRDDPRRGEPPPDLREGLLGRELDIRVDGKLPASASGLPFPPSSTASTGR